MPVTDLEHFKVLLALEESRRIALEERVEAKDQSQSMALIIASKETERRLDSLNGEQTRIAKIQETYYPRQVAEPKLQQHDEQIKDLQISKANVEAKGSLNNFYVGLLFSIMAVMFACLSLMTALSGIILRLFEK